MTTVRDSFGPSPTAGPWKGSQQAAGHSLLLRGSLALHAQGGVHALVLQAQLVHLHAVLLLQRFALILQLPGLLAGGPDPGEGMGGHGGPTAGPSCAPSIPATLRRGRDKSQSSGTKGVLQASRWTHYHWKQGQLQGSRMGAGLG